MGQIVIVMFCHKLRLLSIFSVLILARELSILEQSCLMAHNDTGFHPFHVLHPKI
jgi:hypothetical protein